MISPVMAWMTRTLWPWMSGCGFSRGSSEADVVQLAVDPDGDVAVVDAVVADPELVAGRLVAGAGFWSGGAGDGRCCVVWE